MLKNASGPWQNNIEPTLKKQQKIRRPVEWTENLEIKLMSTAKWQSTQVTKAHTGKSPHWQKAHV